MLKFCSTSPARDGNKGLGMFRAFFVICILGLTPTLLLQQSTYAADAEMAYTDVIILKDGSRLIGLIASMDGTHLHLQTKNTSNTVKIKMSTVASITSQNKHTYVLESGSTQFGTLTSSGSNATVSNEGQTDTSFELSKIKTINPTSPVRHTGNITLSASIKDGNTQEKQVDGVGDYKVLFENGRITLNGEWEYEEERGGNVTERNASFAAKYDYFYSKKLFFYGQAGIEGDDFDNLDLRTTAGAGVGWQFFEDPATATSAYIETGVSFLNEDFETGGDDRRLSSRVSLRVDRNLWDGWNFFHFSEFFLGWEDEEDCYANTSTGVRVSVYEGLYATAQVNWDWDNIPSPGNSHRQDLDLLLGLGYSFAL